MASSQEIFSSFASYYEVLCESLNTEFYGETYPDYQLFVDNGGKDVDIIKSLLANESAQEAFDNFLKTLFKGVRYAPELLGHNIGKEIVEVFLQHGAVPNWDIIFNYFPEDNCFTKEELSSIPTDDIVFEDYHQYSNVRALIIDILAELKQPIDDEVSGISDVESEEFPKDVTLRTGLLQMIKFHSQYYSQHK
jgi:hypothetical protein